MESDEALRLDGAVRRAAPRADSDICVGTAAAARTAARAGAAAIVALRAGAAAAVVANREAERSIEVAIMSDLWWLRILRATLLRAHALTTEGVT